MRIAFFGSSLVSAYWNGAATYYRGILRALAERGHTITFYEPDAYERQAHRDIPDPPWATDIVYPPTLPAIAEMIEHARGADLVVKASGVGVHDEVLEQAVLSLQSSRTLVAYWDVDAPATLERLAVDRNDALRPLIPRFDIVFTYGGGAPVTSAFTLLGARACVPIYNALDPSTHHPLAPDPRFAGALGFLGNRLPDREARVDEFFLSAARRLPEQAFLLGGAGWEDKAKPANVRYLGHVYTHDHNAFNVTPLAVLNISRDSMAAYGFSPATRVFEAAGAGACLITDAWIGIEQFLEPGIEVLVAEDGAGVADYVASLTPEVARQIGSRARARMLREHTYAHRAIDVERALGIHRDSASVTQLPVVHAGTPMLVDSLETVATSTTSTTTRRTGRLRLVPRRETTSLSIAILGLSITSSWGNGHATTYRGLVRALVDRGHEVTFYERDVPWYAGHRDLESPACTTLLYADVDELQARYSAAIRDADLVIVGSYVPDGIDVGRWVLDTARGMTAFYDIDTPVTFARVLAGECTYLDRELAARYGLYLSFCGGPMLERIERELGASRALPMYCSVDPAVYRPSTRTPRWDLGYMGTYSADRQPPLQRLLVAPARLLADDRFVVAGAQYPAEIEWPSNVERIEHLPPDRHAGFYAEQRFALNVTRADMIAAGWSPSVRLFEAAACGTPIISDAWAGLDELFAIDREILVARDTEDVLRFLRDIDDSRRREIGALACARVHAAHTPAHRAADLERYTRSS